MKVKSVNCKLQIYTCYTSIINETKKILFFGDFLLTIHIFHSHYILLDLVFIFLYLDCGQTF